MQRHNVVPVKVLAAMQIVVHLFQHQSVPNAAKNQNARGVQCAMERPVNVLILSLAKIKPSVIMERNCASAASALGRFVLVGIKPSASLPQRKCPTIRGDFVSLHAKTATIQIRAVLQVNLDLVMDCQKEALVFDRDRLVITSKVCLNAFNFNSFPLFV